jgi:hypothetical protein
VDELDSDLDNSKEAKSLHDDELDKLEKEGLDDLDALSDDENNKNGKKKEIVLIISFYSKKNLILKVLG